MLLVCNSLNIGLGGFAIEIFGFAVPSYLLHLSRCDLVSRFQPVSSSAATPVLRPSCIERSLKRAGEKKTSVRSTAHLSKQVFTSPCTDSLLGLPGNAFDVNTRFVHFSKSLALHSSRQSDPTVPELAGRIPTLAEIGTLVCTMSSTLTLVDTEELTGTSALELEPP